MARRVAGVACRARAAQVLSRLRETEEEVDLGLGRSLGGPGDLSKDVQEVSEKVPVGLARRERRGNGERLQRRVARGGAVHLEKREKEPAAVALILVAKRVEEPAGPQRGTFATDLGQHGFVVQT